MTDEFLGLRKVAEQAVIRGVKMPLDARRVLALLDRVETSEQALQRVRELHQETPCDGGCIYGGGAIPEEWGVTGNHCSECTVEPWPCATIRALEGGE